MSIRSVFASTAFALALSVSSAAAGPFSEAEAQMRQAYGDYRSALFLTNSKNKSATEVALAGFLAKWGALSVAWKANPPPQYVIDPALPDTLDAVARIAAAAESEAARGDLAKSHETLEEIRDLLGALRARNGVIVFSDRMNAYHAAMEHAVDGPDMAARDAVEHAAVLAHLAKALAARRPEGADAAEFDVALKAVAASVATFQNAARSGDKAAIDAARKALKPPYSRMFLRFG